MPVNHQRTLDFVAVLVEWIAVRLAIVNGERLVQVDDAPIRELFRQNPGVYAHFVQVARLTRLLGLSPPDKVDLGGTGSLASIGTQALISWLSEQKAPVEPATLPHEGSPE